jgi:hypothetical protein
LPQQASNRHAHLALAAADSCGDDCEFGEEIGGDEGSLKSLQAPGAEMIDGVSERVQSGADVMAEPECITVAPFVRI